jgi:hypothetical protein
MRGGLGDALSGREWLLQVLNKSSKIRNIFICPSTSSFQAQKTRREGACYSNFRPEGGVKVLERSKWWVRGNSHGIQKLEMDMVECMH